MFRSILLALAMTILFGCQFAEAEYKRNIKRSKANENLDNTKEPNLEKKVEQEAPANLDEQALALLTQKCQGCHNQENPLGNFDSITDIARMLNSQTYLVAGKPDTSLIFQRMQLPPTGNMPPSKPMNEEELLLIKKWIVSLEETPFELNMTKEEQLDLIAKDIEKIDGGNRNRFRYFSLVEAANKNSSPEKLEEIRQALTKTLNSLSYDSDILKPKKIDSKGFILRVNLNDMNMPSEVFNNFIDEFYPYTLAGYSGKAGDSFNKITSVTQNNKFLIRAEWFIATATVAPHYDNLLRLPSNLTELEDAFGINTPEAVEENKVMRSGFVNSGVSAFNRIIERQNLGLSRFFWRSYDFANNEGSSNILTNPLGSISYVEDEEFVPFSFAEDGGEIIFQLPNGLPAYYLVNNQGNQIHKGPTAIVRQKVGGPSTLQSVIVNGISCMSCHHAGILEKKDQVRDFVINQADQFNSQEVIDKVKEIYPKEQNIDDKLKRDNRRVVRALEEMDLSTAADGDPINPTFESYNAPLDKLQVAAELFANLAMVNELLKVEPFKTNWNTLLVPGGKISRDIFNQNFGTASQIITEVTYEKPIIGDFIVSDECLKQDPLFMVNENCIIASNTTNNIDLVD